MDAGSLKRFFQILQDSYDLISSQEDPDEDQCTDQFNPAIIAGPRGSPYFKAIGQAMFFF